MHLVGKSMNIRSIGKLNVTEEVSNCLIEFPSIEVLFDTIEVGITEFTTCFNTAYHHISGKLLGNILFEIVYLFSQTIDDISIWV